ncbi:hypothetical protein N865_10285 [Intrasporangium oryzae NRRL B-24470]|uniref:AbiEi antitoxin C-terminal domain-containing protein n=1 Tax=Intrasporangium oryzae NRRL B-24470 TaxID=1386089 RepID=W9G5X0_9MICO|nr:hypothetical protein [Intrasporangium oryzae]EWT01531.1 hypothetical protein N865_10285 [Intrasporangium oryzae NRRL B-24470]
MELPEHVLETATRQGGLVTRAQLIEGGVAAAMIRWQMGRRWRSVLPGVIQLDTGLPSFQQRMMAALLAAGPESWLSGVTAAGWHGMPVWDHRLPIFVMVPAPARSRRIAWVSIRATSLTNERLVERGALRFSCRPRSVVDAAAQASDDSAARSLVIGAVQNRLVRVGDVQHWLGARRRNGTIRLKTALREASAGSWSVPEAQLARLARRSHVLPPPWANPQLSDEKDRPLTTPDLWCDDVALAVMVHSLRFHSGALDWDATVDADEDLRAAGVEVVGVTPSAIEKAPDTVLARIEAGYLRAAGRPRPPVTARPRDFMHEASG